jgi:hypothetical protein
MSLNHQPRYWLFFASPTACSRHALAVLSPWICRDLTACKLALLSGLHSDSPLIFMSFEVLYESTVRAVLQDVLSCATHFSAVVTKHAGSRLQISIPVRNPVLRLSLEHQRFTSSECLTHPTCQIVARMASKFLELLRHNESSFPTASAGVPITATSLIHSATQVLFPRWFHCIFVRCFCWHSGPLNLFRLKRFATDINRLLARFLAVVSFLDKLPCPLRVVDINDDICRLNSCATQAALVTGIDDFAATWTRTGDTN